MMKRVSFSRFRIRSSQSKREFTETDAALNYSPREVTSHFQTPSNYFHAVLPWVKWLTALFVFAVCLGVVILIAGFWFRIILPITLIFLAGCGITKAISLLFTALE